MDSLNAPAPPASALTDELLQRAARVDDERDVLSAPAGVDAPPDAPPAADILTPEKVAADLGAFLEIAATALAPAFPKIANVWTPDTCRNVASAAAPVMIKRGWILYFGAYADEIRLGLVLVPLIAPTMQALKITKDAPPVPASTVPNAQTTTGGNFVRPHSTAVAAG